MLLTPLIGSKYLNNDDFERSGPFIHFLLPKSKSQIFNAGEQGVKPQKTCCENFKMWLQSNTVILM